MSRGHGRIQDFILAGVTRNPDQAYPTPVVASWYAEQSGAEETSHLRASVRRAIGRLHAEGAVSAEELLLPTRVLASGAESSLRLIRCVAAPGVEWTTEVCATAWDWMGRYLAADHRAVVDRMTGR